MSFLSRSFSRRCRAFVKRKETKMRKKSILIILFLVLCFALIFFVKDKFNNSEAINERFLKDIAYKENSNIDDITVYVKENGVYVPYLAVTNDYDGHVLLLRKFLLNEAMCFSKQKAYNNNSCYSKSYIDNYLNNSFLSAFSSEMQEKILSTQIDVAVVGNGDSGGDITDVETISRKIFLLSARELGIKNRSTSMEGTPLMFFKNQKSLIACTEDGVARPYWSRTPCLDFNIQALAIGANGRYADNFVSRRYHVRPAFCLDGNLSVKTSQNVIKGKSVYVI